MAGNWKKKTTIAAMCNASLFNYTEMKMFLLINKRSCHINPKLQDNPPVKFKKFKPRNSRKIFVI